MKNEIINRLSSEALPIDSGVFVQTHLPFIISGKYSDYKEGEMVSTTLEELTVSTLANKLDDDNFEIILNGNSHLYKAGSLELTEKDRGTLKAIVFGIYSELKNRGLLNNFEGIVINAETNINMNNGFQLNFIANILLSIDALYEIGLKPEVLAEITQQVYIRYFGKTISFLNCLTLFINGINRYDMKKNVLNIEHLNKDLGLFKYLMFENGERLKAGEYNVFYARIFNLYDKVKKYLNISFLSDIDIKKDFGKLFSPTSVLSETEKLMFTHYLEENKRAKTIFMAYNQKDNARQLIEQVSLSANELGAYDGFNKFEKYVETNALNGVLGFPSAVTHVNDEITNMFVFITLKDNYEILVRNLNKYKNYFFYEVHPSKDAYTVTILKPEETNEDTSATN